MPISNLVKQTIGETPEVAVGSKLDKLIKATQWENPICHVTITPHENQKPDFCRFVKLVDNPISDSIYARFHKPILRGRLLVLLKAALRNKKEETSKKKAA